MTRRLAAATGGLLLSAVSLTGTAHASNAPQTGFGSKSEPMTTDHGSGGLSIPLFRFFNPCAALDSSGHSTPRLYALLGYGNREYEWKGPGSGSPELARLHCRSFSLRPYYSERVLLWCDVGSPVRDSFAYTHPLGPVVTGSWDTRVTLINWGWVNADVTVWWLCR